MTRAERIELARRRIRNILLAQAVACDRTLEQKISDAGPNPQRVEPSVLTQARKQLHAEGAVLMEKKGKAPWYFLKETYKGTVERRMDELVPLHLETQAGTFTHRLGQTLEIAVLKAIKESGIHFLGNFSDLAEHNDATAYTKVDPPMDINGRRMEKGPLDFVVFPEGGCAGIEVKNYRTWLYPRSKEVKELLWKCGDVGAVPVLIARRLPFLTIRLLQMGGCLVHENYNQLYPEAEAALADRVRSKNLLGYHDVRVGNEPDGRMLRFFIDHLAGLVREVTPIFQKFRYVHSAYGRGDITYYEWLKRLRASGRGWTRTVREEARAEAKDDRRAEAKVAEGDDAKKAKRSRTKKKA
jgi:hypothetical protein